MPRNRQGHRRLDSYLLRHRDTSILMREYWGGPDCPEPRKIVKFAVREVPQTIHAER